MLLHTSSTSPFNEEQDLLPVQAVSRSNFNISPSGRGLLQGPNNLCSVYMLLRGQEITIITIHVDNCTITASKSLLQVAKDYLTAKFNMQDLSKARHILGMEIIHHQAEGKLFLQMKGYINKTLAAFGMVDLKPVQTPMVLSLQLPKLVSTPSTDTKLLYHRVIRKLLYLAITCQPNIYYITHYLSHFVNGFSSKHYQGQAGAALPQWNSQPHNLLQPASLQCARLHNSTPVNIL